MIWRLNKMVNEKVLSYLKTHKDKYGIDALKAHMIKGGFLEKDVDEAIVMINSENIKVENQVPALESNQQNTVIPTGDKLDNFKKLNFWKFLVLIIFTLNIYYIRWFKNLNKSISGKKKISMPLVYLFVIFAIFTFAIGLIANIVVLLVPEIALIFMNISSVFTSVINFSVILLYLIISFNARGILKKELNQRFGVIGTFFFGALYLQVRINTLKRREEKIVN